jgi:hypothetical protein
MSILNIEITNQVSKERLRDLLIKHREMIEELNYTVWNLKRLLEKEREDRKGAEMELKTFKVEQLDKDIKKAHESLNKHNKIMTDLSAEKERLMGLIGNSVNQSTDNDANQTTSSGSKRSFATTSTSDNSLSNKKTAILATDTQKMTSPSSQFHFDTSTSKQFQWLTATDPAKAVSSRTDM